MVGASEDVETGLVLDHELLEELVVEPVQVVERVEQAVAAAHAEEERHLAEAGLQIDDHGGPLAQARELHGTVHGNRRRAGAPLRAHERDRRGGGTSRGRRAAARGRPDDRFLERLFRWRPGEELVRAGAHRLQDEVRVRVERDHEDGHARRRHAQAFDVRQRRSRSRCTRRRRSGRAARPATSPRCR